MASRSKGNARRDRDSDSGESLKPLVVLALLGTILYGAWSVVNKGPGGGSAGPAETVRADVTSAPAYAPQVELPASTPLPAQPASQFQPQAQLPPQAGVVMADPGRGPSQPFPGTAGFPSLPPAAAAMPVTAPDASPTYLSAVSAPPPMAGPAVAGSPVPPQADGQNTPFAASTPALSTPDPSTLATGAPPASAFDSPPSRYAAAPPAGASMEPSPPSAAFASAWADAHDKLAAGRYAEALAVLSTWHDDPSLGLEESQRLEDLLGQLAGTVVYSQQDLLLPPHVVAQGETLLSIAAPLAVPWQLLAKINGVADPARLVPGESLKLIRGPFDAVVSVSRRRLSLKVGGNYAGSFPVVVGRQIRERIGSALPVVAVQSGDVPAEPSGPTAQVAWSQPGPMSIGLADGLAIEGVADPSTVSEDTIPGTSLIVAERDLREIADILGQGSRVLVRQ
jgi:LysM repeat protein